MNNLDEFKARLESHDWLFYMSDDPRVYQRGEERQRALHAEAKTLGVEGIAAYQAKAQQISDKMKGWI